MLVFVRVFIDEDQTPGINVPLVGFAPARAMAAYVLGDPVHARPGSFFRPSRSSILRNDRLIIDAPCRL